MKSLETDNYRFSLKMGDNFKYQSIYFTLYKLLSNK